MAENKFIKIGELAKMANVSLRTIRYYHELGLIHPAKRTSGNFRLYNEDSIAIIILINNLKNLGFSLDEIKSLIEPSSEGNEDYAIIINRTRNILLAEKKNVEEKLKQYSKLSEDINRSLAIIDCCYECREKRGFKVSCKPECINKAIHIKFQ